MRKKLLVGLIGIVAILMLALNPMAFAENTNSTAGVGDTGATFEVTISGEGQFFFNEGSDLASIGDRDKVILKVTQKIRIIVVVADCCVMGDTIAIFYPYSYTPFFTATSPKYIMGTDVFYPGTYTFYIGYTKCPGGFPAGYYMWIISMKA